MIRNEQDLFEGTYSETFAKYRILQTHLNLSIVLLTHNKWQQYQQWSHVIAKSVLVYFC